MVESMDCGCSIDRKLLDGEEGLIYLVNSPSVIFYDLGNKSCFVVYKENLPIAEDEKELYSLVKSVKTLGKDFIHLRYERGDIYK